MGFLGLGLALWVRYWAIIVKSGQLYTFLSFVLIVLSGYFRLSGVMGFASLGVYEFCSHQSVFFNLWLESLFLFSS